MASRQNLRSTRESAEPYADERTKYLFVLTDAIRSQNESYHNHKENISHAIVIFQSALVAGLMTLPKIPPLWYGAIYLGVTLTLLGKVLVFFVALVLVVFTFGSLHVYLLWQLRNKRMADHYVRAMLEARVTWLYSPPIERDIQMESVGDGPLFDGNRKKLRRAAAIVFFPSRNVVPTGTSSTVIANLPRCVHRFLDGFPTIVLSERLLSAYSLLMTVLAVTILWLRWDVVTP